MELSNRVAVVTGSSRGLGRGIVLALARAGADVAVCARAAGPGLAHAEAVRDEARALGVRAEAFAVDLSQPGEVRPFVAEVRARLGRLDLLVLNAARAPFKPLERLLNRELRTLVDVNFVSQIACVRESLPLLEAAAGTVVFVSSLGSRRALPCYPLGSLKAAMEAAVRDLAASLAPRGIAVNGVCAGIVRTDSFKTLRLAWPEIERVPEELVVTAEEVAEVVLFLASPAARGVRGQIVVVDRGLGSRMLW